MTDSLPSHSSISNGVGPERKHSRAAAEKNHTPSVVRVTLARRLAPTERNAITTRARIQQVRVGQCVVRITGPGRRRIRQFGCHGGTPCVPKHVNPALRRPWIRETGRSVEQGRYFRISINTHRRRVRAARAIPCKGSPSHPRALEDQVLKGSLPLCSKLARQLG